MKKTLIIFLIIVLTLSLFGCQSREVAKYNFEYKFKPEYSDKISSGIAGAFIDMTKDVEEIYLTALEDFEVTELEKEFDGYASDVYSTYKEREEALNEDEKVLLNSMEVLWFNVSSLKLLKDYYAEDQVNKSMGIATKNTDEYYEETLKEAKSWLEESLDEAMKFIN